MAYNKMAVVPYDQYMRMKAKAKEPGVTVTTTPNEEKVVSLDHQMREILNNNKLNDYDKMAKYTAVMSKYIQYKEKMSYDNTTPLPKEEHEESVTDDSVLLANNPGSDIKNPGKTISSHDKQENKDISTPKTIVQTPVNIVRKDVGKELRRKMALNDLILKWIHN